MLKIQEDESIHSLIYRTHKVNGIYNFTNLVNDSGDWMSFPKILKETLRYYEPIDEALILDLLRQIGVAKKTSNMFSDPTSYQSKLSEFFRLSRYQTGSRNRTQKIKCCLTCIRDSINSLGFGYFKNKWYEDVFCDKHNCALIFVKASNKNSAIDALHEIFEGKTPKDFEECNQEEVRRPTYKQEKTPIDFISPCLEQELKRLIIEKGDEFPESLFNKRYYSARNIQQQHILESLYEKIKRTRHPTLLNFFEQDVEIKPLYTGAVNIKALSEEILKYRYLSCSDCIDYKDICAVSKSR